jgi:hypothetical protein
MAKRDSKAGARLRQLKNRYEQELRQLKEEFSDQLLVFEQELQQQLYGQAFYHEALINLLTSEDEPESDTLIGAMVFQRWLTTTGQQLQQSIRAYRTHHLA